MSTTEQRLTLARRAGELARYDGKPIEHNPYSNVAGGRPYHRAWRTGWLAFDAYEVDDGGMAEERRRHP